MPSLLPANKTLLLNTAQAALTSLAKPDFADLILNMLTIGAWLQQTYQIVSYQGNQALLNKHLSETCLATDIRLSVDFNQRLAFEVFKNAWSDHLTQEKMIKAKAGMDKKTRRQLKLGIQALDWLLNQKIPTSATEELHVTFHEELPTKQPKSTVSQYWIIPPQASREGHLYFCQKGQTQAQLIQDQTLQTMLQNDQLLWQMQFQAEHQHSEFSGKFKTRIAQEFADKIRAAVFAYHCRQLDKKAYQAIAHYRTWRQQLSKMIGSFLAAIAAFTYGAVTVVATLFGFFVAAHIVWTNPWMALAGGLLLAATVILPFPSTWLNWKVFSAYTPEFYNKIVTEYQAIPSNKKKALFWLLSLLALATGIAGGGLAYTATIALPALFGLGAVSAIFPPLGILFAAAIMVTQTCSLIRNFAALLRKKDSWQAFKEPFFKVNKILQQTNASRGRRFFTWMVVIGLTFLAALGLVMSCFTSTRSVGKLFIDQFKLAPARAVILGAMISGVSAFLSRMYFTLDSAISSGVIICQRLLKPRPERVLPCAIEKYHYARLQQTSPGESLSAALLQTAATVEQAIKSKNSIQVILTDIEEEVKIINQQTIKHILATFYFVSNQQVIQSEKHAEKSTPLSITLVLLEKERQALLSIPLGGSQRQQLIQQLMQRIITAARTEMLAQTKTLAPLSLQKVSVIAVDSVLAGAFYAQNMLSLSQKTPAELQHDIDLGLTGLSSGAAAVLATAAFLTTGSRYIAINLKHTEDPPDPLLDLAEKAAARRCEQNQAFYLQHYPQSIFAPPLPGEEKSSSQPYADFAKPATV